MFGSVSQIFSEEEKNNRLIFIQSKGGGGTTGFRQVAKLKLFFGVWFGGAENSSKQDKNNKIGPGTHVCFPEKITSHLGGGPYLSSLIFWWGNVWFGGCVIPPNLFQPILHGIIPFYGGGRWKKNEGLLSFSPFLIAPHRTVIALLLLRVGRIISPLKVGRKCARI